MADTLPNVLLPVNEWVDLYAVTGLTVGVPIVVENLGVCDVYLAVQASMPVNDHQSYNIISRENGVRLTNSLDDLGAWAYCASTGGKVSVSSDSGFYPLEKAVERSFSTILNDLNLGNIIPKTAFRASLAVEELTPLVQLKFDLNQMDEIDMFSFADSSIDISDGLLSVSSGTVTGGFAAAVSKRTVLYRAGTGLEWKGTGLFEAPIAGISQYVGLIGATDSLLIGYHSSQQFGVLRFHHGVCHIEDLTITAGTGGPNETAVVTVDGTAYNVDLVGGLTVDQVAYEIAVSLNNQIANWQFDSIGDQVVAINVFVTDAVNIGSFAYAGNNSAGNWVERQAGSDGIEDFTPQADWNVRNDLNINPQGLTPFRITMQYLGGGAIEFFAEDTETGNMIKTHIIQYSGTETEPSVRSPSFRVGVVCINNTANGSEATVKSASLQGVIQGKVIVDSPSKSAISPVAIIGSTLTNVLTIRNREEFANTKNIAEIVLNIATATSDSGKATNLLIIKNAIALEPLIFEYQNGGNGLATISYTNAEIDPSQGEQIDAQTFIGSSNQLDLRSLNQALAAGESLTIAMQTTSGPASEMTASLTWFDDK